jgi:hypothetical protein
MIRTGQMPIGNSEDEMMLEGGLMAVHWRQPMDRKTEIRLDPRIIIHPTESQGRSEAKTSEELNMESLQKVRSE